MDKLDNVFYFKYPHFFELSDPKEEDGFSKIAKEASRQVKKHNIKFIVLILSPMLWWGMRTKQGMCKGSLMQ